MEYRRKPRNRFEEKVTFRQYQTNKYEPSAFESEILPLHKPGVYDKGFRPPEALRGLAKREEVMTWRGILL